MNVAYVQLARHGDLVSLLPVMYDRHLGGDRVACIVHRDFAPILEAVSYVEPVLFDGGHSDVRAAYDLAVAGGRYDRVIATQVNGAFEPTPVNTPNFVTEQWARAGRLDAFHDLPLIFDRRDAEGEAAAMRLLHPKPTGKPILAYSLAGYSSPFRRAAEFERWLVSTFSGEYDPVNLCAANLPKVHHLLGVIERAAALVTIDSLPLHLGYAFGTPTIALHCDADPNGGAARAEHFRSEPREHWLGTFTYAEAVSESGGARIRGLLLDDPNQATAATTEIRHVVPWFEAADPADRRRMETARASWDRLRLHGWRTIDFHPKRTSTALGDPRGVPYVGDLMDAAAEGTDGPIVLTNADSVLTEDAAARIRDALSRGPCCYSRRIDFAPGSTLPRKSRLGGRETYAGTDLFACTAGFWRSVRDQWPDVLAGCEGWDAVMRWMWQAHNPSAEIDPPVVSHERHEPFWSKPENATTNPGQVHNRKLCREWAERNGKRHLIGTGRVLFLDERRTGGLSRVAHGAVGIARAVTGTGGASAELIDRRSAICAACEHWRAVGMGRCDLCGCLTWAKVRNKDEKCPVGKW